MGHIIEWYYNGVAGIQADEPGFAKVTIRPFLPEGMTEFICSCESVKGEIRVHVKESANEILPEAQIPDGVEKTVDISNLRLR